MYYLFTCNFVSRSRNCRRRSALTRSFLVKRLTRYAGRPFAECRRNPIGNTAVTTRVNIRFRVTYWTSAVTALSAKTSSETGARRNTHITDSNVPLLHCDFKSGYPIWRTSSKLSIHIHSYNARDAVFITFIVTRSVSKVCAHRAQVKHKMWTMAKIQEKFSKQ